MNNLHRLFNIICNLIITVYFLILRIICFDDVFFTHNAAQPYLLLELLPIYRTIFGFGFCFEQERYTRLLLSLTSLWAK